jgi:hypothetical protein
MPLLSAFRTSKERPGQGLKLLVQSRTIWLSEAQLRSEFSNLVL